MIMLINNPRDAEDLVLIEISISYKTFISINSVLHCVAGIVVDSKYVLTW